MVLFYVLIVCIVTLPPGVNPIAVDKYILCNLMKTRPVEEEVFQADTKTDGRTDRHNNANCPFSH